MFTRKLQLFHITTLTRHSSQYAGHHRLFLDHFAMSPNQIQQYLETHRLLRIEPETILKSATVCEQFGFDRKSILSTPMLLRFNPLSLDQYYNVMIEGGFINITPQRLSKFRTYYRRTVGSLKDRKLIHSTTDVVQCFIKYLNPRPDNFTVINNGDREIWSDLHKKTMTEYLKWRLEVTQNDIDRLLSIHPGVCRKSFKYLCENIEIAQSLGFTNEKILKYGYLLQNYPKYTRTLLEKYSNLAGADMRKAMRMYPKLVMTSPTNVEKIYEILKQHNIPDTTIRKRMNIFHMSPKTVKLRLEELERSSELKVLMHNPCVLKLIVHHNRAKARLALLKELQLKCTTVSVLGNDNSKFDVHVKEGRDVNTSSDIRALLKGLFGKDSKESEGRLQKHPFYLQVPLVSIEETYNYLRTEKFSSDAIFDVLTILLYPKEKIRDALQQVAAYAKERNKDLGEVQRLNLILYFIEREHHFTGNGVWLKGEHSDHGEEEAVL